MASVAVDRLLDELARARADGPDVATTSLNVIAFVENDENLLKLVRERISALSQRHSSRSIVLAASEDTAEHQVQDQQVEIGAASLGGAELHSLVHDLLVPDVHSVLLWGGEHVEDERFGQLAQLADVVVVFSSVRDLGLAPLRELLHEIRSDAGPKIRDLSYMRLFAWQDLTAQFFDDPDLLSELGSIETVEVTSGSEPEAYYYVGWLASRLNWEACGANEFCNPHGKVIRFTFSRGGAPHRVQRIILRSGDCEFGISLDDQFDDLVCLTVEGKKSRPHRCLPLHDLDMISLVERAIFEPAEREIFQQTLDMVARLLQHTA
ncbi:MAG TPA: glucose-6-phosphate dehydrogenase assembly protein OpcA [Candidatus Baltobacteraceae bacterium]|jgi:glucose-6-phosphate dehydrogenase assembly protein OpcA|nr:glucose-6-phosphate dehydrogenase assembly protein OpcA [Candidatus Baltobacteraceae bacterium]